MSNITPPLTFEDRLAVLELAWKSCQQTHEARLPVYADAGALDASKAACNKLKQERDSARSLLANWKLTAMANQTIIDALNAVIKDERVELTQFKMECEHHKALIKDFVIALEQTAQPPTIGARLALVCFHESLLARAAKIQ